LWCHYVYLASLSFRAGATPYGFWADIDYCVGGALGGDSPMIELQNLVAGYDGQPVTQALNGVIERGSMTAIIGANGCGKSTLLKTLAAFIPPVSGGFRWQEKRPVIGWLAQRHSLEAQFPLTVQDVVSMGCWPGISLLSGLQRKTRLRIASALERVGLQALATSTIDELSGGQFQRMLFARVLVQNAPLVMLDEPFTGVDEATCNVLMELMLDMYLQGQTVLAVLHDSERVARHFPQTLRLDTGTPCWATVRARVT
jgi:zinc/manganese transport system ATP-binding protein